MGEPENLKTRIINVHSHNISYGIFYPILGLQLTILLSADHVNCQADTANDKTAMAATERDRAATYIKPGIT
jgi:hypothetical protein